MFAVYYVHQRETLLIFTQKFAFITHQQYDLESHKPNIENE